IAKHPLEPLLKKLIPHYALRGGIGKVIIAKNDNTVSFLLFSTSKSLVSIVPQDQPGIELRRYVFAGIDQKVSVQLLPVDVIDGYSPEGHIGRPPLYYILSGILVRIEPDLVADRKPGSDVVAHSSLAKHPVYIAGIGSVFGYPIGIIHTRAVVYIGARYRVFKRKL